MRTTWTARMAHIFAWLAFTCGLGPLMLGVALFAIWLVTLDLVFPVIGILLLYPLLWVNAAGFLAWMGFGLVCFFDQAVRPKQFWMSFSTIGGVLVINYPVAFFMFLVTMTISSQYRVEVRNDSDMSLQQAAIQGPGSAHKLGTVEPGEQARGWLWFDGEGAVSLAAQGELGAMEILLDSYVDHNTFFKSKIVTVHRDGTASVTDRESLADKWFQSESNGSASATGS